MLSAQTSRHGEGAGPGAAPPVRRCIASRESLPVTRLVRFVVAPDGRIVADVEGRLPGRGLWLRARRDIVEKACAGNLFAKAARARVVVDPGLAERTEALLVRRCLDLLGLARRAGQAVAGFEKVRARLSRSGAGALFLAADGADGGRDKLRARAPAVPVVAVLTGAELGAVFGRERTVHVAVAAGGLLDRLLVESARLAGFRAPGGAGEA